MNLNLAYIAGVCYGDGCVRRVASERGKCLTVLNVSSEIFARSFATAAQKLGLTCNIYKPSFIPDARHKSQMYRATFYSVKFYQWFKGLTFDSLDKLLSTSEDRCAFIRGFYESEGCYFRRRSGLYLIAISNTKGDLIRFVHSALLKEGFDFHTHGPYNLKDPKWKPVYQLTLYKQSEIFRFLKWLDPCIKKPVYYSKLLKERLRD
jgi:intein-encoded DNA endonuclease-like protein